MGAFVRQIVALSALWTLGELLLPEGGMQRAARLVISLMTMAVLLTTLGGMLGSLENIQVSETLAQIVPAQEGSVTQEENYAQIALRSYANQAEDACVRMGRKAGYEVRAAVYLRRDGSAERLELNCAAAQEKPLLTPDELRESIAQAFAVDPERITLTMDGDVAK